MQDTGLHGGMLGAASRAAEALIVRDRLSAKNYRDLTMELRSVGIIVHPDD